MAAEDKASRAVEQEYHRLAELETAGEKAKGYIDELQRGRIEAEAMEEKMADDRSRAEKREARNKRLKLLEERFKAQEAELPGDKLGYGFSATLDNLGPLTEGN